ncbi:DUF3885 domain-containing protein [Hymenobacter sp. HSC-4F20]|uniref:DUF3885 domain-containing protein n=1 Tax=Hymenobacter sp. HSC-4F20 TaxID=2864135 RepID=UPI001C73D4C5|nr:DUF3885 domain-containing protein [Hymenobacter sp. HSC-4F20]MBX0292078.1 DUF3885 domain-containing protein [Hymenobacter sp. HSC-4F20]
MASPLTRFLQQHYPSLRLSSPLFYSWPFGLRFDLQHEHLSTSEDAYFQEVVRRASLLFQATFASNDPVVVVHQEWRHKRPRIRNSNYLLQQLSIPKAAIHFQRIANPYSYGSTKWMRAHFSLSASQVPYPSIFAAIGNQDFGNRKPVLHGDTFFLNQRTSLIFYMYDDRGLDIIGPDVASLRYLYEEFNELILDYDRPQIDALFAT